ncbi:MAG: hypothetical protein PVI25_00940 [Gammaproteobacteria bacterium]
MTMQGISERAMRELAGVNAAFISVVTMDDAERRGGFGLADEIISRLRLLDDESRRRMAYRPFALFTLNFRDSAGWKQLVEQRVHDGDAAQYWPDDASRVHQFLAVTLAAVRELAEREPPSASVLFGIPPVLVDGLRDLDIGRLPAVATKIKPWLKARCATRHDWWSRMIVTSCAQGVECPCRHRGLHTSLMRALGLDQVRVKGGRLCRRL